MTNFVQPATALPAYPQMAMQAQQPQMAMQAQPQLAMQGYPGAQQQMGYGAQVGYGSPYGMGAAPMGYGSPYGMAQASPYGGQPVYINSLSQLPPGAVPASQQMLAQALGQGQLGAQQVEEGPSKIKSVIKFAALGAAAGAAFGLIPFLPLGLFSGAIVGAVGGAILGFIKGGKKKEGDVHTMEQQQALAAAQAQAGMVASTPPGARSGHAVAAEARPAGVVMGPEMRKKWAAKVRAEKAAAAARP